MDVTDTLSQYTRLPLLRADLGTIVNATIANEAALKTVAHEASWEWLLHKIILVCHQFSVHARVLVILEFWE